MEIVSFRLIVRCSLPLFWWGLFDASGQGALAVGPRHMTIKNALRTHPERRCFRLAGLLD